MNILSSYQMISIIVCRCQNMHLRILYVHTQTSPHPPRKLAWDNFPLDNSQPKNFQISGKGSYLRGTCSCHGWKLYGGKCRSWELCKCTLSQCLSRGKPSRWGMQGRKGCPSMATATQGLTTFQLIIMTTLISSFIVLILYKIMLNV